MSWLKCFISIGFLNQEIEKAEIPIVDTGENPEAPHPREMIDLEVRLLQWFQANVSIILCQQQC